MIAGLRGRASSRRRRAAPWIALLVCLGLCLGWHPEVVGVSGGSLAEVVVGDAQPADGPPAVSLVRHGQSRRDPRAQNRGAAIPGLPAVASPASGAPGRRADAGGFPALPQAQPDRLTLLSISRI
ncbi:hypothetical protein FHR32_000199 [Streptosporangium album]|uniref:Uncharacterized protein n=1 Tax=Streptosporangium album TaxID=47479 RepID=A0A7W7W7C4_9ACTN|nr:hypothetical protein [Streptosporangium album]MBB4935894.1 hypothetical protein [Streptosporangium album]